MLDVRWVSVALILALALIVPGLVDKAVLLLSAAVIALIGRLHSDSGADEPGE